jgi:hypothetical protein
MPLERAIENLIVVGYVAVIFSPSRLLYSVFSGSAVVTAPSFDVLTVRPNPEEFSWAFPLYCRFGQCEIGMCE